MAAKVRPFSVAAESFFSSPLAFASDSSGMRTVDSEPITVIGIVRRGITIPAATPKAASASLSV